MSLQDIFPKLPLLSEWTLLDNLTEKEFASWIKAGVGALVAFGVFGIGVVFPLQVKLQAPEATLAEIYATLWDCVRNAVQADSPSYQKISSTDLVELLKSKPAKDHKILVVDTRTYQDFRTGHIEGSVFLPFNEFRAEYNALPKNKTVVILCQFGHYSVVAANMLLQAGYPKVLDYSAGMEEWTSLQLPVATGMLDSDLVVQKREPTPSVLAKSSVLNVNHPNVLFPENNTKAPVYLDYNATTPLDPQVLEQMMPYLTHEFGNAASRTHRYGQSAEAAVHQARTQVANVIHAAHENEIVFTSGASESNNLAIKGIAHHQVGSKNPNKNHIITCVTEHKAVLDTCQHLEEEEGFQVTYLGVGTDGRIHLQELIDSIRPGQTFLVSIMLANNEIGTIQPFREIGKICRANGVLFHTDGTQGVGKLPHLNVLEDCIDLMSISAHKLYGPKGVGALYVRSGIKLKEQINGGGHEGSRRSGTLNVPGIVGLGHACALANQVLVEEQERVLGLRRLLEAKLSKGIPKSYVNGSMEHRLAGNLHMSFEGVTSEQVLMELGSEVAISSGSACNSRKTGPSHVLVALDLPKERMNCTLRFGIGRFTNRDDIVFVAKRMIDIVSKLREESSSYE